MDLGLVLTIVGLMVTLIGLPLTYHLGRRNRQLPVLHYVTDFAVLMSPRDRLGAGNLDLSLGGYAISSVSRTYVAVWNERGDTIRSEDISGSDPLRIVVGEGDNILQSRIISTSRIQCEMDLREPTLDSPSSEIVFDFLDPKDGAVIEVLHHGEKPAQLIGTLRGATIKNRGDARLTPRVLEVVSSGSVWDRYFLHARRANRFPRIRATMPLLFQLLLLGLAVIPMTRWIFIRPEPVVYTDFAMDTIQGQQEFLAAAETAGIHSTSFMMLFPFTALMLLVVVFLFIQTFYNRFLIKFPTSLARVLLLPEEQHAEGSADIHPGTPQERPSAQAASPLRGGRLPTR